MEENKYAPMTEEQYKGLKTKLSTITNYLPDNLMGEFWSLCNLLRGEKTGQPCGCRSAGGLWANCVGELKAFVQRFD